MDQEQQHFDARAEGYETEIGNDYPQWLKWHLAEKYSTNGASIVDVGGANGRHALALAQAGRHVSCVDLSPGMLQKMQNRVEYLALPEDLRPTPIVADARELPIADVCADLSLSYATLLLMPDQERAISELIRVTKPNGHIILDLAMPWNIGWLYWRRYYRKLGFPGIFPFSMPRLRRLLEEHECVVCEEIATGALSQLLYIPFVEAFTPLRQILHRPDARPDLDGRITAKVPCFANRRYVVLKKANAV